MASTVTKWGNSLAVRIPSALAKEMNIEEGTEVDIDIIDGTLTVTPKQNHHVSLDELVEGITPENCHTEIDYGASAGNEAW